MNNQTILKAIEDAVAKRKKSYTFPQGNSEGFRTHLGASVIGQSCVRSAWYDFRWASTETPEPRMIRLWARGDREEFVFEDLLRNAGFEIYTEDAETGTQFRISDIGGHFGGSLDGIVTNVPGMEGWGLLEFKTHNEKSFKKLQKEGVKKSKPQHFAQMQTYMGYKGLAFALYCAVNKNNDELYFEVIEFDSAIFNRYKMRADLIVNSEQALEKMSSSPAYFECRFCKHIDLCHRGALPMRNCRTCAFAHANPENGKWECTKDGDDTTVLSKKAQEKACQSYRINPEMK